ncbi:hypothetical protein ABEB36_007880 [Hypothenemus hampei]|uniref:Uncharacterized protein n=1 Tax=Hypothenemus hampei TaxID=57062 RepID=A0ABD1EVE6_HYPHA
MMLSSFVFNSCFNKVYQNEGEYINIYRGLRSGSTTVIKQDNKFGAVGRFVNVARTEKSKLVAADSNPSTEKELTKTRKVLTQDTIENKTILN